MSRENEEIDLKRMLELFDAALSSQDPRIKEQLRKLLLVVALIEPDLTPSKEQQRGPLSTLYSRLHELEDRLRRIEMTSHITPNYNISGIYSPNIAPGTGTYTWAGPNAVPYTVTLSNTSIIPNSNITFSAKTATDITNQIHEQLDLFSTTTTSTKI